MGSFVLGSALPAAATAQLTVDPAARSVVRTLSPSRPIIEANPTLLLPAATAISADGAVTGFNTALANTPTEILRVYVALAGLGGYSGIYYATFSSTTACQLWVDPAATTKPSGLTVGAYAGTTAAVTLGTTTIAAGQLPVGGSLRYLPVWVGSAGSRTYQVVLNGNVLQQATANGGQYVPIQCQTFARGANRQYSIGSGLQTSGSIGTVTSITPDTTPVVVEFRAQLTSANDWAVLEAWCVELLT